MTFLSALTGLAMHALLHLLVIGALVCLAVAVALRGTALGRLTSVRPRARYVVTVAGFVAVVVLPLAVQGVGVRQGSGAEVVQDGEQALAEASGLSGRSAQWPLRPPADADVEAWWRWISIGPWSRALSAVWATGILVLTAWSALGWWRFRRQRRRWAEAPDALRRSLDFPAGVALFTGPEGTPLATGLWRPDVYLPRWALTDLEPAALTRIARHELAHVRWRDPLVDRGVRILRGLFWPVWPLWFLARLIRREREAAADRAALAPETATRESSQALIDYAETLWTVAARRSGLVPLVGAAGELEYRVRRLLRPPGRSPALARAVLAALLLAGTAVLVLSPLPAGSAAGPGVSHSGEDTRNWGPLDHFLGFNPSVEFIVAPGVRRLRIQGHELDAEQIDRWQRAITLAEKAAIVREAEELAARAPPAD